MYPQDAANRGGHRLAPNGRLATLIHELSHAPVGLEPDAKLTYAQEEIVVESIAWSCCQTVGLDTSTNSIPYLASWAEQASLEVLEQTAAITGRLAQRIEDALLAAAGADEADPELAHQSRLADRGLTRKEQECSSVTRSYPPTSTGSPPTCPTTTG